MRKVAAVGNGRTAEEKESEPAGGSDHFLHKGKIPEEMFVAEDNGRASAGGKHFDDLIEELFARVEFCP